MLFLRNIKKAFANPEGGMLPILDVAEFHIGAAQQVLLMGRSGSGKTTLLQIIAGLMRADAGKVEIAGQDIGTLSESQRDRFRAQHLGYVFQTFNLLPGFSALENVLLAMSFGGQKADAARARTLLGRVGLSHRVRHKPSMLSVGEQQRVSVARALANRPKLLLADEPTASVDARHQQQIVDLIRETCREEDVALLMVTHADEIASQFERIEHLEQLNQAVAV
jgi:putative ABC transport system ATP-binding protein